MIALKGGTAHGVVDGVPKQLLIGGEWRDPTGSETYAVEDPALGEVICEVARATPEDAIAALAAADAAQEDWAQVAPRRRSEILRRAYELVVERTEDLSKLMTLEMGKPVAESRAEVAYAADFLLWFSEEAVRLRGSYQTAPNGHGRILTMRQPVGPCLLITPWNFPLAMGTRKIAPALAAGCTVVIKPAAQTPLCTLAFAAILEEAGVPAGVVNVVTGDSAGRLMEPLIRDPRARKLSFTGSTEVGRLLVEQSATELLRLSMELGGNAAFLVFEDADIDLAVEGALLAKMRNGGEACTAANRFYVHDSLSDEFTERFASRIGDLAVGHGLREETQVGPLIDGVQRNKVTELVDDAVAKGATVACGGSPLDGPGYFYEPTVLADVPAGSRLLDEEIFGPVAPIVSFSDDEQAVKDANGTEYGLVAYVFTRDLDRALRVSERLKTGMIGLNQGIVSNAAAPFGGVKASGFGREGGEDGILEYLDTKYVAVAAHA